MEQDNIKPTIWDKYTHVDSNGKQVTNLKAIILQLHGEIQILHEAMTYVATIMKSEEDKDKIEVVKPGIILPD